MSLKIYSSGQSEPRGISTHGRLLKLKNVYKWKLNELVLMSLTNVDSKITFAYIQ